jgi:hypothetical protein
MLPQLAQGPANKIFIIPSEFNQALGNLGNAISGLTGGGPPPKPHKRNAGADEAADAAAADAKAAADAAAEAAREASSATPGELGGRPTPGALGPGPGEPPAQGDPPPQNPPGV